MNHAAYDWNVRGRYIGERDARTTVVSQKHGTMVGQASVPVTAGRDARPTSEEGRLFPRQYTGNHKEDKPIDDL